MYLYGYLVHGEPLDPMVMAKDMVVWGAAGTLAGPLARTATTMFRSKIAGYSIGGGVAGGSEYTLGNLFQGKMPNIKTAATVTVIAVTLPFLAVGVTKAVPMIKGTPQVAQTTTQVSDTAVSQAGKRTSNVVEDTGIAQGSSKTRTIIDGNNHITVNPDKVNGLGTVGLDRTVAGDDIGVIIRNNDNKITNLKVNHNVGYKIPLSTYQERLAQTPVNNGKWTGQRGESTFISDYESVNLILNKVSRNGVNYRDAIPDFSPVSRGQVEIPNMSVDRRINFREADEILAKELGVSRKEIVKMRKTEKLTWHELNDMKTMQLVPTEINSKFGHLGGVAEVKKLLE
ncbi:HNH endonuclease [Pseudalkalibacillus sp. A8]|uniref:HNH endonuclease n=1 Tax=Pseudalkalibacillus sp. A8 TaxID=3382641 RepID=UPI0038B423BB